MTKNKVYILVDCSGSMSGIPIQQASQLTCELVQSLNNNSNSCKSKVSIITYNMEIKEFISLSSVSSINFTSVNEECAGPKNLGQALKHVNESSPEGKVIFIITKGKPSDVQLYNEQIKLCKKSNDDIIILHGNIEKSGDAYNDASNIISPWDDVNLSEIIKAVFGGKEKTSQDGRNILQEPPKVIDIII